MVRFKNVAYLKQSDFLSASPVESSCSTSSPYHVSPPPTSSPVMMYPHLMAPSVSLRTPVGRR